MADQKVSDLDQAVNATTDLLYLSQSNTDKKSTVKKLFDAINKTQLKDADYTVQNTDDGNLILVDATDGAVTITLESAAAVHGAGFVIGVKKIDSSANAVTIDADGSEAIDGALTKVLSSQNDSATFVSDGADWQMKAETKAAASSIVLGTPQASTSGTSIDFTDIPSGTKRITMMLIGVSTSSVSNWIAQIGDSDGIENSGYVGNTANLLIGSNAVSTSDASGLTIINNEDGFTVASGIIEFYLEDSSDNTWIIQSKLNTSGPNVILASGYKALSAELDRVRLTTFGGSNTFDAGEINIQYD